jgi:CRISPR-associated protein Cmr1
VPKPTDEGWQIYPCKLVTPLYGGGVRAGEVDREMPIRAASIRGQLRFWWRVACANNDPPAKLFKREVEIWGGIAEAGPKASQVGVRIQKVGSLDLAPAHTYVRNPKRPGELRSMPNLADWAEGYALFSAQGKLTKNRQAIEDQPKILAKPGTGFELGLNLSIKLTEGQRKEVLTALRWWASFGGIGARTRRGLGAIKVEGLDSVTASEVAACGGRLVPRKPVAGPTEAWKQAVGRLKDFRQKVGVGRNPPSPGTPSPAGRSLWPEADTIRSLSGSAAPRHSTRIVTVDAFPRALFGLPIVFHFKDAHAGDPDDHVLEPADLSPNEKRDRMASPLVLRPYWNGSRWQPAALLLPGWGAHLSGPLKFKDQGYVPPPWPAAPTARRVQAGAVRPMVTRGDDALGAFMAYFAEP